MNDITARLVPVEDIISLSLSSSLDEEQQAGLVAMRLRAFADPTRVRILRALIMSKKKVSVIGLSRLLGIAQSCISRHLKHLVFAGFLGCIEVKGKNIHYYYAKLDAIRQALDDFLGHIGAALVMEAG